MFKRPFLLQEREQNKLCSYGCGKIARYQFKNGKLCCSEHFRSCLNEKNKLTVYHIGKSRSEKSLVRMREARKKRSQKVITKKEKQEEEIQLKIQKETCSYGCGKNAKFYFKLVEKFCCEKYWSKCSAVKDRMREYRKGFEVETSNACSFGCGNKALYYFKKSGNYCCSESPQQCQKIKEKNSKTNKIVQTGELNGNWKGGISFYPYSRHFNSILKDRIKNRDKHQCQNPKCESDANSIILTVHHIDYDKQNFSEYDLITLCDRCNSKANGNRDHWKSLYQKIIEEKYREVII